MHTTLNISIDNERGINALAKRLQLAHSWEAEGVDVALMGETQKNTGGMETGASWSNEYVAFFSTGIKPKVREMQEKKRLEKWDATKKTRKKKTGISPRPIAKAVSKYSDEYLEKRSKNFSKGKTFFFLNRLNRCGDFSFVADGHCIGMRNENLHGRLSAKRNQASIGTSPIT
jgi:hypothetical protein